jgi:hypothetical protein
MEAWRQRRLGGRTKACSMKLIQGKCVPISSAIRLRGHGPEDFLQCFPTPTDSLFPLYLASFIHHAIPTVAISQI